ncbi:MAG: hydrolase TatD [Opitutae bacterium]|nr:hydrolase TatD [Opitutae bacterium]|tara:strand:+ start:6608 stop:7408 length:801 start_codon:yes stop_codon:yes gene_type:complete
MSWFDSHCHLKNFWDKDELPDVLERARRSEVSKMVTVGTSQKDWYTYRQLCEHNPSEIYYSAGLHPGYVNHVWEEQVSCLVDIWKSNLTPIALGEVGLDYFRLPSNKALAEEIVVHQKNAFREQLKIGIKLETSLIVHSRNAFNDCVQIIDESGFDWNRVVFHCFSEKAEQIKKLGERGGWVSFTGILTYKANEDLRDAFLKHGIDRLMIETDSPYLTPVPVRGKENEPAFLKYLGKFAAELAGMHEKEFSEKIFKNTKRFYQIGN